MLRALANGETFVSATMCPHQCVLVYQGLKLCVTQKKTARKKIAARNPGGEKRVLTRLEVNSPLHIDSQSFSDFFLAINAVPNCFS